MLCRSDIFEIRAQILFCYQHYSIVVHIRGYASWLYIDGFEQTKRLVNVNPIVLQIYQFFMSRTIRNTMWSQGVGRHTRDEFMEMMLDDIRTISQIMGKNQYLLGDEVCEDDFAIFGMLANCLWTITGSPYEKLITGNHIMMKL